MVSAMSSILLVGCLPASLQGAVTEVTESPRVARAKRSHTSLSVVLTNVGARVLALLPP